MEAAKHSTESGETVYEAVNEKKGYILTSKVSVIKRVSKMSITD